MGIKVTLRKAKIKAKKISLYLDYYPPIPKADGSGLTRREYLKLHIHQKPTTPLDKRFNKETLELAEQIRQKRHMELNKPEVYSDFERERLRIKELGDKDFIQYFTDLANKRKSSNHDNWMSSLKYLVAFSNGNLKFKDVNEKWLEDFKDYLLTTKSNKSQKAKLAQNSAVSYFNKVKATLKQAFKDGILQYDLNGKVSPIPYKENHRQFLTIDELNSLIKTKCNNVQLKNAALFSALTGLRFSDIQKLIWKEIGYIEELGYQITFTQKKTKGAEVLPISAQAYELLGERGKPEEQVFKGLKYSAYSNKHLYQWIGKAGIDKDITFHCFRHTYAVLQLANGTDIYTVSKLLGHKDLKTTQIYANVVDIAKREAADKIQLNFD